MDRPENLIEYRKLVLEKNLLEKRIDKMKPAVRVSLEETGGYDDLYLSKVEKDVWHEDVIYDWIAENYPEYLYEVSKLTVDIAKFGELAKRGLIPLEDLPLNCRTAKVEWHIKTTKKAEVKVEED